MRFDGIWIEESDLAQFMNEVKPQSAFTVEIDGCYWVFEFTTEADYNAANKWVYANCPFIYPNDGYVFFDNNTNSYAWKEFKNNTVKTGFNNPDEAEESLFTYLENIEE